MLGVAWILLSLALFSLVPVLVFVHARRAKRRLLLSEFETEFVRVAGGDDSETEASLVPPVSAPAIVVGRPPRPRHPLVFVHGYFGFDAIGAMNLRGEYFRGVRGRLEALGHQVYVARMAKAAGIKLRAAELARQIERLPHERVNIIAHSMGGVDARYAISRLGLYGRVASLVT